MAERPRLTIVNVAKAGGVMSGIEMSLWLVGQLFGEKARAHAANYIAYDMPPRGSFEDWDQAVWNTQETPACRADEGTRYRSGSPGIRPG